MNFQVSTARMMFTKQTGMLGAEASELGLTQTPQFLDVVSHRTQQVVTFRKVSVRYEGDEVGRRQEGDVLYWVFQPMVACGVRELVVWND